MEAIPQQVSSFQMTPLCTKLTQTNQHRVQLARHGERSQALKLFSSHGHHVQWFRLFTTQTLSPTVKKELKSSQFSTCHTVCPCTVPHTPKGTLFQFTQKTLVGQLEPLPAWAESCLPQHFPGRLKAQGCQDLNPSARVKQMLFITGKLTGLGHSVSQLICLACSV